MKQQIKRLLKRFKQEFHYHTSNQIPILFDHLPKCGGTTINSYLVNHYPDRNIFRISGIDPHKSVEEFKKLSQKTRWNTKLVYGHAAHALHGLTHPDTLAITVFREPVDRIISHYYYVKRTKSHYLHDIVEKDQIQLGEYCSLNLSKELSNWYVTHFTGFSKQDVEENPEKSVELALKNILEMYDLIGFQENMLAFIYALKIKLSLKVPERVGQKNKTRDRLQVNEIDQDVIDKISKNNGLDLILYSKLLDLKKNGIIAGKKFH